MIIGVAVGIVVLIVAIVLVLLFLRQHESEMGNLTPDEAELSVITTQTGSLDLEDGGLGHEFTTPMTDIQGVGIRSEDAETHFTVFE
jgi:hypothetical protein